MMSSAVSAFAGRRRANSKRGDGGGGRDGGSDDFSRCLHKLNYELILLFKQFILMLFSRSPSCAAVRAASQRVRAECNRCAEFGCSRVAETPELIQNISHLRLFLHSLRFSALPASVAQHANSFPTKLSRGALRVRIRRRGAEGETLSESETEVTSSSLNLFGVIDSAKQT